MSRGLLPQFEPLPHRAHFVQYRYYRFIFTVLW